MLSSSIRRTLAATLFAGTSSLAIAHAQTTNSSVEDEPETLSTVIVSGVGPQRETDEMIGNATAVTRDEIVQSLSASLGNSLDSQPGVATTHFGQAASRPVLRGLGAERVLVLTNGIGVIDASAASPAHQVAGDGIDADKIEILRGPAALAYGGQAIGGVVNVIDGLIVEDLPDEAVSGEAYGAVNGVNEGEEGALKTRFSTGPFVLTLSASARDFGDYDIPGFAESSRLRASEDHEHEQEEAHEGEDHEEHEEDEEIRDTLENSFVETSSLAAGFSWVGDRAFAGIAVRRQESTYGLPGHDHAHEHEHEEGADEDHEEGHEEEHGEELPFIDLEQTRIDLRAGADLSAGPFTRIAGNMSFADYEHTEFEAPGEPGTRYESDGAEGRVELGTAFGELEGAVGLQVLDKTLDAFGDEAFITRTDTRSAGLFAYQTREWEGGFGIEGGIRYDLTELDNVNAGIKSFDLFSGSFGVHQHWDSGWFVGGQVSLTERAPNESELFADGAHLATSQYEVGDVTLDKERGLNIEGTLRWRGDGFSAGANLFYTHFDGFIYLAPGSVMHDGALVDEVDGLPVFLFSQQDANFTGGEVYADYELDDGPAGADWTARASVDLVSADLSGGGNVPLMPPVTFNASLDADWGLVSAGASLSVAGDQDDPGEGELPTDGYTTLDLRTALNVSDWGIGQPGTQIFLDVRNVTDEEVRYATSVLKDTVPAPGRNVRAGVRLVF